MAQTKRKRQTKHRGNAAGVVESRGRTSRPISPNDRKKADKAAVREARMSKEPTWKSSWMKAGFAGLFMFLFIMILGHPKHGSALAAAIFPAVIAVALFGPANYYLERYLWKKRMSQRSAAVAAAAPRPSLFGGFKRKQK